MIDTVTITTTKTVSRDSLIAALGNADYNHEIVDELCALVETAKLLEIVENNGLLEEVEE